MSLPGDPNLIVSKGQTNPSGGTCTNDEPDTGRCTEFLVPRTPLVPQARASLPWLQSRPRGEAPSAPCDCAGPPASPETPAAGRWHRVAPWCPQLCRGSVETVPADGKGAPACGNTRRPADQAALRPTSVADLSGPC